MSDSIPPVKQKNAGNLKNAQGRDSSAGQIYTAAASRLALCAALG